MDDLQPNNAILDEARACLRSFFSGATSDDAGLMDTLILSWAALKQGINIPRPLVAAEKRAHLERLCDEAERQFMRARDRFRTCPTYQGLDRREQRRIALILFDVFPPAR